MAPMDVDELARLRNRFRKTPISRTRPDSRVLDLVEDVLEPFFVLALSLAVTGLGLAGYARHLVVVSFEIVRHGAGQLG